MTNGEFAGIPIIPAGWVADSLESYTGDAWYYRIGPDVADTGYGCQWWSARARDHRYDFAWEHGGQQIAVLDDQDLVVVVKADPLYGQHGDAPRRHEKTNLNLAANFIASLPSE